MRISSCLVAIALIASAFATSPVIADSGKPVAVRWWGQGFVTIETFWNLTVAIDPYDPSIGYNDPGVQADLVLITHEHRDHNNNGLVRGIPIVSRGLDADGTVRVVDVSLDRQPSETRPRAGDTDAFKTPSAHAIRARTIASFHDDEHGAKRGRNAMFLVEADGVRVLHCGDLGQSSLSDEQLKAIGRIDVLLIPVGGVFTVDGIQAAAIVEQVKPRVVVPIHYKTDALRIDLQPADAFLTALPATYERVQANGNTLGVSAVADGEKTIAPRVVTLKHMPWQMPDEMAELFAKKEAACAAAQPVFAALSVDQMNFKPSNGTHTPRWNVEHMAGTELRFFSSIYANVDPNMTVISMMPKQMPPEYVAAHPDWSGAEEARYMQRVQAFTRRFAYLLDGMTLDSRPKGSPWPLQRLLAQMEFHWNEHTGNVKKKFDLPDWPKQ